MKHIRWLLAFGLVAIALPVQADVLAYLSDEFSDTIDFSAAEILVQLAGGTVLFRGQSGATSGDPVEVLLAQMPEESYAFVDGTPSLYPHLRSYTALRGPIVEVVGHPCKAWMVDVADCKVEVTPVAAQGQGMADVTAAVAALGGEELQSGGFYSHVVPADSLDQLLADSRVADVFIAPAVDPGGPGVPTPQAIAGGILPLGVGHRFRAFLALSSPRATGERATRALSTRDGGSFWIFDRENPEVFVKVLDGCSVNGHFWVFATGLTDLGLNLIVTDAATNATFGVGNPEGTPFEPTFDIEAFPCSP